MYNIQENVRIVIGALKAYNIRQIVVSPGGTNIPISQAVQDDPFFQCYSVVDERSAMYFAIGLYLQTGEIIATSCTSAQATRNYLPGLTEAFYKRVPILAITTSKLERYSYQEYMQAPDQVSLPRDAVRQGFDLPPVTDENTRIQCMQDTVKAILSLTHHGKGPVQLNIRITDSLVKNFTEDYLPKIRTVKRYYIWDSWDDITLEGKKILLVIGESRPFEENKKKIIEDFCNYYNVVIYTNHLSNYHGKYSVNGNLIVSSGGFRLAGLKPNIVITIGGQTGDYSIFGALTRNLNEYEHWRVSEDGEYIDTYNHLTKIFECSIDSFFNRLVPDGKVCGIHHSYFESWNSLFNNIEVNVDVPFSNLYSAMVLSSLIPSNSIINFAILNSLRCWSYFPLDKSVQAYANVAAFGIDGCNSMLIGESMNTDSLCFIITGDLAFFYDMNALGIRHIKNNIRILLINNHGGAEFRFMTRSWGYVPNTKPFISAEGHNGSAKGWSENCGFDYLSASNKEDFLNMKENFVSPNPKPIVFELFIDPNDDLLAWQKFLETNAIVMPGDNVKQILKKIVGKNLKSIIKKYDKK